MTGNDLVLSRVRTENGIVWYRYTIYEVHCVWFLLSFPI